MNVLPIMPIAETADTVTLSRTDYEVLAELVVDARDLADADVVKSLLAVGETEAFPFELAERLLDGVHSATVFREYRGLTAREFAEAAGVAPSYMSEIESGWHPGGADAMTKIASALRVPLDLLVR
ncbi:helix-turn-helix transcriptional regulator [Azospirillum sp. HJ39]|uniref:helix-turn-helix domain-containing protein n=1 Tax=Azospirillum sp. HJ39 TaxID=3159496 RepID=UPI0035569AD1